MVFGATETAFGYLKRPAGRPTWQEYLDLLGNGNNLDRFAMRLRAFGLPDESPEPDEGGDLVL
jgi:hypothetical protein